MILSNDNELLTNYLTVKIFTVKLVNVYRVVKSHDIIEPYLIFADVVSHSILSYLLISITIYLQTDLSS